jgi:5'-nucleotidase
MGSRRKFLQQLGWGAAGVALAPSVSAWAGDSFLEKHGLKKLVILHTNDVHSHIDPFPDNDPKFPGRGGCARRAALIRRIRSEEKNVLLLDAGDIFQGTPYFNYYGGELEFRLMSEMGYDAATFGNHDFDNGIDGLLRQLPNASFPFVNANYDFSNTPLHDKPKEYIIIKKDGIKVGIFGVGIELDGLVSKKLYGETLYLDPVEKAQKTATKLKEDYACDLVICLSHLGFEYDTKKVSDKVLAASTKNIDLIIGGHTHTFLEKPEIVHNLSGREVLINQVGWAGLNLGRIDFLFDAFSHGYSASSGGYEISKKTIHL